MADTDYLETIDEEVDDVNVMTVDVDESLSRSGAAADALVTGQRFIQMANDIADLNADTLAMGDGDPTTIGSKISAMENSISGLSGSLNTLDGATVKTVQGVAPVGGEVTLDTLLAAQADVTGDVDALFTA